MSTTTFNAANKYVPQTGVADAGTGKLNLTTALTFDAIGNTTGVNGPRTDVTDTTKVFDAERRLTQSTDALGKLTRNAFDADGRMVCTTVTLGNGTTTATTAYDNHAALSSLAHNLTGTAQDQTFSYTRNQARTKTIRNGSYASCLVPVKFFLDGLYVMRAFRCKDSWLGISKVT